MRLPEARELEPLERRYRQLSPASLDIIKVHVHAHYMYMYVCTYIGVCCILSQYHTYALNSETHFDRHQLLMYGLGRNISGKKNYGLSVIGGLDYWTEILEWTTGMTFDPNFNII